MKLGGSLRAAREARGLSVRDLAFDSRVDQQVIYNIENGSTKDPRWSTVASLSAVLGWDWLKAVYPNGWEL